MTSRVDKDGAATNVDYLVMFVAAIRAVAPDLFEAFQNSAAHRKNPQRGLNSVGVESGNRYLDFKTGTDVWTWARNRYEPFASLVWSLSEGQMDVAQHLVDGMLQELKVANLVKFADQVASRRDRNFHPAF